MFWNVSSLIVALSPCCFMGCHHSDSDSAPATQQAEETQQPARPIPPDSPFAKIQNGMDFGQACALIGQPTSTSVYQTGKAWIPFHYGGDNTCTKAHYKGIGTITLSQNNAFSSGYSVMEVDYDPSEPGF